MTLGTPAVSTVALSIVAFLLVKCSLHVGAFCAGAAAAHTWIKRTSLTTDDSQAFDARFRKGRASTLLLDSVCHTLCNLAERMAGDVHAHAEAVGAATQELAPVCQASDDKSLPLKDAAVKTVAANIKLQRRLEEAERKIRSHIGELRQSRRQSL